MIPNRAVFRAQDVCELAQVEPYVLRSWEAEFPDLGVAKTAGGPRIYRRADVDLVLRLKHLLFVDGLTLAGARRQLGTEPRSGSQDAVSDADVAAMLDDEARRHLRDVRHGLQWILGVLDGHGMTPVDRVLHASPPAARASRKATVAKASTTRRKTASSGSTRKSGRKR